MMIDGFDIVGLRIITTYIIVNYKEAIARFTYMLMSC